MHEFVEIELYLHDLWDKRSDIKDRQDYSDSDRRHEPDKRAPRRRPVRRLGRSGCLLTGDAGRELWRVPSEALEQRMNQARQAHSTYGEQEQCYDPAAYLGAPRL